MAKHTRITRRQFMAGAVVAGAALAAPWSFESWSALAFTQSVGLQKFIQPLRGIGPGGIAVAAPDAFPAPVTGVTHYSLTIAQFTDRLHPHLGPTKLWGTTRLCPWAQEHNPSGTWTAFS